GRQVEYSDGTLTTLICEGLPIMRKSGHTQVLGDCDRVHARPRFTEQVVPKTQGAVLPGRGQRLAVGTKGEAQDRSGVAGKHTPFLHVRRVPEAYEIIVATAGNQLAVGTEGHAANRAPVPLPVFAQHSHDVTWQAIDAFARRDVLLLQAIQR